MVASQRNGHGARGRTRRRCQLRQRHDSASVDPDIGVGESWLEEAAAGNAGATGAIPGFIPRIDTVSNKKKQTGRAKATR